MKMICAPSQVMREGRDLNQHGQAGRQEQASSSSPLTFHAVLFAVSAALPGTHNALMPHTMASETIELLDMICFITLFSLIEMMPFSEANVFPRRAGSISKERAENARPRLDTTTGAPASGPAPLPDRARDTPGRRPALRRRAPALVVVSRCALSSGPSRRHSKSELLTNASFRLSGDQEGTFMVPWPP